MSPSGFVVPSGSSITASVPFSNSSVPRRSPSLSSIGDPRTTWMSSVEPSSIVSTFGSTGTITTSPSVS